MLKLFNKNKDEKWFKEVEDTYFTLPNANYIRPDFEDKAKLFRFYNGDLQDYIQDLNLICNDVITVGAANDMLLHYNKIKSKYDVLHGEILRRGNNHKIVLLSAKAIKAKNDKMLALIQENVEKDLQVLMSKVIDTLQTMPSKDLEQFIQEERQMLTPRDINYKNFLSDIEIYKSKMLRYIYMNNDILKKKAETFQHQFIGSEFYIKNVWRNGKPDIDICNPLYCSYHKAANDSDASKSDWFRYVDEITIGGALDEYLNILSEEQIRELFESSMISPTVDKKHMEEYIQNYTNWHLANQLYYGGSSNQLWGLSETITENRPFFSYKIKRQHLEFKAYDEQIFYTHKDEYGDYITVILDGNTNVIPKHATKLKYTNEWFEEDYKWVWEDGGEHQVEIKWIPRRYEMTKLGSSITIQKRKVPFQPANSDNPYTGFTLSYKGGTFNNVNSKACSRMEAALPSQMQIIAAKALQNKEMGKFRGSTLGRDIAQVPKELASNKEGQAQDVLTNVEVIGKKTGVEYFNSGATHNGLPNPQRGAPLVPMNVGDPSMFIAFQQFIQLLDMEVGLACGVPPQREGQMVQGNVTDNQQVLVQTSLATEKDFFEHARIWNEALTETLNAWDIYFKNYFENHPNQEVSFLEYVAPDGTKELIEVIPSHLSQSGYGLFLQDAYSDKEYKEMMKNQIYQNTQDISIELRSEILKGLSNGASSEEIHRSIQLLQKTIEEKQMKMQEAEQQAIEANKKAQMDLMKYQSDLRLQEATQIAIINNQGKLEQSKVEVQRYALESDINANQINDNLEIKQIEIQADKEMQDKQIEADIKLKEMDIQAKKDIEKMKPKPKTSK